MSSTVREGGHVSASGRLRDVVVTRPARRRSRNESGSSVAEFAIVLPVLVSLLLGIVTTGLAVNNRLDISQAAREATRYGATLPVSNYTSCGAGAAQLQCWLAAIADATTRSASGALDAGTPGRNICVAYVHPNGTQAGDTTTQLTRTDAGSVYTNGATCFTDDFGADDRRVQVLVRRDAAIQVVVFSTTVELSRSSVTLFEAA
jgi:Flp pilus assembly protein TadG